MNFLLWKIKNRSSNKELTRDDLKYISNNHDFVILKSYITQSSINNSTDINYIHIGRYYIFSKLGIFKYNLNSHIKFSILDNDVDIKEDTNYIEIIINNIYVLKINKKDFENVSKPKVFSMTYALEYNITKKLKTLSVCCPRAYEFKV